ncbi:MAG TPA: thioredoxin family protein [Aliidongia sp.]|uniref:thioredoxin family protein n=1 Tax=Aliidongia sp. TaxID=1914230 RepID=UPI002DDCF480|nr:thioredoxin family protein [Aliidongia sp.]HEV2675400.1 thioredoxin family protein [Aliidongia sp.]
MVLLILQSLAGLFAIARHLRVPILSCVLAAGLIVSPASAAPAPSGPVGALFGARQWLNTPPLHPEDLRGKVVLVNFWTYSCINCLRVLPHVRAWAEAYKDRGLVVIGVHTPEFAFEKDVANVRRASIALGVGYPVAIDSDFAIWRAFGNQAWPALYFIGADGRIRQQVLGEGSYAESERLIQKLLSEAGAPMGLDLAAVSASGAQAAADERDLRSDETYIGYGEARNFASPGGAKPDASSLYHAAPALPLNRWSLDGAWTVGREFATLDEAAGSITYRFHARDLHLVLAPPAQGRPVRFRVTIDGAPPGADHGADVDTEGWGLLQDDRLYQLVRQEGAITDRTFRIEFSEPGVRAYAFTFG